MHLYKDVCAEPDTVEAALKSFYKHSWYLDSTIILLPLLDKDVFNEEKSKITSAMLQYDKL